MRFAVVAILGAIVIGVLISQNWHRPSPTWLGLLGLTAVAVGFAAGWRGWLAAFTACTIGMASWLVIELRPSPPWSPSDVWGPMTWLSFLLGNVLPVALGAAALGGLGGWLVRFSPGRGS